MVLIYWRINRILSPLGQNWMSAGQKKMRGFTSKTSLLCFKRVGCSFLMKFNPLGWNCTKGSNIVSILVCTLLRKCGKAAFIFWKWSLGIGNTPLGIHRVKMTFMMFVLFQETKYCSFSKKTTNVLLDLSWSPVAVQSCSRVKLQVLY